MAEVNGSTPSDRSKKKRWYGDRMGGGVKTALGIKRKPNRKDRLKARGQGVLPQAPQQSRKPELSPGQKTIVKGKPKPKQQAGQAPASGGEAAAAGAGEKKRKFGDGATPFDRASKHKQQRLADNPSRQPHVGVSASGLVYRPAAQPPAAAPVAALRPSPAVPKTERAQKIQELLRKKLVKAGLTGAVAAVPADADSAKRKQAVDVHVAGHGAGNPSAASSARDGAATRDASVTVVQGKVAAGKVSSNWQALKQDLKKQKRLEKKGKGGSASGPGKSADGTPGAYLPSQLDLINSVGPLGIDCEMVGVGDDGRRSVLARVSIVDGNGEVVMDTFVAPQEKVTDYRTRVSGVRPQDLKGAPSFQEVQNAVAIATKNKIIIGHSLQHDLKALMLTHEKKLVRDTAKYRPYQNAAKKPRKLRDLAKELLGMDIQGGEHSSVEDARATLLLYKLAATPWEKEIASIAARLEGRRDKRAKKQNRGE